MSAVKARLLGVLAMSFLLAFGVPVGAEWAHGTPSRAWLEALASRLAVTAGHGLLPWSSVWCSMGLVRCRIG